MQSRMQSLFFSDAHCAEAIEAFACDKKAVRLTHDTNAKFLKVSPFSKIFIRKLYRVKNSKFYCHENYPLCGSNLKGHIAVFVGESRSTYKDLLFSVMKKWR